VARVILRLVVVVAALATEPAWAKGEGGFDAACFATGRLFSYGVRTPENVPDMIIAATNIGIVVSRDGGETFRWICPPAYARPVGADHTTTSLAGVGALADGTIFILSTTIGYRFTRDHCTFDWAPDTDLQASTMVSIAMPLGSATTVLAAMSWPGLPPYGIFKSADGGRTFDATPLEDDDGFSSLHINAGTGRTWALSGTTDAWMLSRSDDLGDNWAPGATLGGVRASLAGSDPTNDDELYASTSAPLAGACDLDTTIHRSIDGGDNFSTVREIEDIPVGLVVHDDGSVWLGFRTAGIEASADGAPPYAAPANVPAGPLGCLRTASDGSVLVCPLAEDGVLISRRGPGETSFVPLLTPARIVGPVQCADGTDVSDSCDSAWAEVAAYWGLGTPGTDDGAPLDDGGPTERPPGDSRGDDPESCACAGGATALPFVIGAALFRRRRR
jgi:hypothetical protein